jgi:hypothetical protein
MLHVLDLTISDCKPLLGCLRLFAEAAFALLAACRRVRGWNRRGRTTRLCALVEVPFTC